jgi:capsular polysaccharide biosynthesis protein
VSFSELKFITSNNSTGWPRPEDIKILRDYFQSDRKEVIGSLKVYVPRLGESRSPVFEKKLVDELVRKDWKIFDAAKHSLSEQISVFSSASQVAGVHGAGLTGATWMAKGTIVHEISPQRNVRCFSRICSINKIRHNRIVYLNQSTDLENVLQELG